MFVAISCKKEVTGENPLNASATPIATGVENSITLLRNTNFGSIILGNFTNTKRVSIAKKLNAKYVRSTITMRGWRGRYFPYEAYIKSGIQVVLNVNQKPLNSPAVFPKDLTNYREKFNSITNKYKPPVIVVENEEINPHYHIGPMTDYINMLKVALDVCHSKGIKVTNGGIYGPQLEVLAYRYLRTKSQNRADNFANNCMYPSQVKAAKNPGSAKDLEKKVRQLDTLLNFYHNLDYINVHLYEPFNPYVDPSTVINATPFVVAGIQEYLKTKTGKPVMTNETGQRDNTNPDLVASMLQKYDQLNFPYAIWYSGTGEGGCKPLHNLNTGNLYNNGISYSNFLANY